MCELDAILLKNDNKERLMESVSKVLVNKNEIELELMSSTKPLENI